MWDIILIILAFICILIGIAGSILPALPGPPLSYTGVLILYFLDKAISTQQVVVWGIIVVIISLLDYFVAPIITRKGGGSRSAAIGSTIGVLVCLFFPISMFLGAFLGAMIGELTHNSQDLNKAFKVGIYSFVGFLSGVIMKILVTSAMLVMAITSMF